MLDTMTPDIMHDLNEGVIPFLMRNFFKYCLSTKIFPTEDDLIREIQFHDFGFKNRKNCPSLVSMVKNNLNQNATQSKCLFQHIPYIFHKKRESVEEIWICVQSLLRITQIAYSSSLNESDIRELENNIKLHLENVQKYFKIGLTPKHHFITHYPNIVRSMGPLVSMSMMRFESKHKTLKEMAHNTNNFINLTKTIAIKHQQISSLVIDSFRDKIACGKIIKTDEMYLHERDDILRKYLDFKHEIYEAHHLDYNIFTYKTGLLISENNCLLAHYAVVQFSCLNNKNVYEKKVLEKEHYIILDTLELEKIYSSINI